MTLVMCNINVRKRHEKDEFLESRNTFQQEFVLWVQYRPSLAKATGKEKWKHFVVLRVVLKNKNEREKIRFLLEKRKLSGRSKEKENIFFL